MTTNSIDTQSLVAACDSRWSAELDADHHLVLDDSGFHKIAYKQSGCMVVAGDLRLIEGWMKWFAAPTWDFLNTPALDRYDQNGKLQNIVFHLILANGRVLSPPPHPNVRPPLEFEGWARFVGTGAPFALNCFAENRSVTMSVETAGKYDVCTGGPTLHRDVRQDTANVPPFTSDADGVLQDMINRGVVMNSKTMQPVGNLAEFAARKSGMDGAAAANLKNLVVSAPTGAPAFVWTQEQKSELMKAFAEMAVLEAELQAKK